MNYSHGIINNVTQNIRMAYENDIVDANIIPSFVKMQIYIKINFLNAKIIVSKLKTKNVKKNEKNYFVSIFLGRM